MPIGKDVQIGKEVRILHPDLVNLYGCSSAMRRGSVHLSRFRSMQKSDRAAKSHLILLFAKA